MIPIRDNVPSVSFPAVNYSLIAVNCIVFILQMLNEGSLREIIFTYGLVPARYSVPEIAAQFTSVQQAFSLLSFMFLHGGLLHLIGNMWFLYIFGDNVEDRLGSVRYLICYLLCGWISALAHIFTNIYSDMPTIGASGAVAGVMGAYLVSFPKSRIITLIPILFIPYFLEIPAPFFLGFWVFFQFISAALSDAATSGIAWWAHIGGFIAGIILLKIFLLMPESRMSRTIRKSTEKQYSPRYHVARATTYGDEADTFGTITISPAEAASGTNKLVSLKNGPRIRTFSVRVPPGTVAGSVLRLPGLGKDVGGRRGDFYLRVAVFPQQ